MFLERLYRKIFVETAKEMLARGETTIQRVIDAGKLRGIEVTEEELEKREKVVRES